MGAIVRKGRGELYHLSVAGEYATICLDDWGPATDATRSCYGGTVMAYSSFGNFCHTWSACSVPFKQFLRNITFERFMSKCLGSDYLDFDAKTSFSNVRRAILAQRREGRFSAETARELWLEVSHACDVCGDSELLFLRELDEVCNTETALGPAQDFVARAPSSQATGFWAALWPEFVAVLYDNTTEE